jgi:molybdate transport system permease protein
MVFSWRSGSACLWRAVTTVIAMLIGVPLAWWLAHGRNWWHDVATSVLTLPLVLPRPFWGFIC